MLRETLPPTARDAEPAAVARPILRLVVNESEEGAGSPERELWRQVDELAGAVRMVSGDLPGLGPAPEGEEMDEALTEALAFSDLYEVLVMPGGSEEIRRTGHPEAGVVLEAAARVLPDYRLARAARKSAIKARTHRACG